MDPKIDFYMLLDKVIDEELEDNTDKELIWLILQNQQQVDNNYSA